MVALGAAWLYFCPGATACGCSCSAHVRPCASGRFGRCPSGSGVMCDLLFMLLHGESSKRLAPPRNTENRKHLQSTQSTVNRHTSQTKHQALSKGQPGRRITPTQQPCTLQHSNNQPSSPAPNRVITRSSQPTQPAVKPRSNTQAGSAALHHRHHPPQRGQAAPPTWGAHHQEWLMASPGRTAYF